MTGFKVRPARRPTTVKPHLEALEDRTVPAITCKYIKATATLNIRGDNVSESVKIRDNGKGGMTVTGTGFTKKTYKKVRTIDVQTRAGNDNVFYNLIGDLNNPLATAANTQKIRGDLGKGFDNFLCDLGSGRVINSPWSCFMEGGDQDDTLTADCTSAQLSQGMVVSLLGRQGNDKIQTNYSCAMKAGINFILEGDDGNDTINGRMRLLDPIPAGVFCNVGINGHTGNDALGFHAERANTSLGGANYSVICNGGPDTDTCSYTGNAYVPNTLAYQVIGCNP